MNMKFVYGLGALLGLFLSGYGLYCSVHMHEYIGTGQYWSNSWFYKAHACLFGLIALSIAMSALKDTIKKG
jgi:hypothetical protein